MKCSIFLSLLLVTSSSFADIVKIACEPATKIDGAESISSFIYELDTNKSTARLKCDSKDLDDNFCGNYRFDLSKFLSGSEIDGCNKGHEVTRQMFNFLLVQEDEFDNYIMLTATKSCKTGALEIDRGIQAIITENSSHEEIYSSELVNCKVID